MPIPFHCHDCDKPTMNKNGLCDDHQPILTTMGIIPYIIEHEHKIPKLSKEDSDFIDQFIPDSFDPKRIIILNDLSQKE